TGHLPVLLTRTGMVKSNELLCKGALNDVSFVPHRTLIAYVCQDGDAGTWDWQRDTNTVVGHVDGGGSVVTASEDGRYLLIGGLAGTVLVADLTTSIVSTYLGHTSRITSLLPPSAHFPYIASADTDGRVRIWPLPSSAARIVMQSKTRMMSVALISND